MQRLLIDRLRAWFPMKRLKERVAANLQLVFNREQRADRGRKKSIVSLSSSADDAQDRKAKEEAEKPKVKSKSQLSNVAWEWTLLALIGVGMACVSICMDLLIDLIGDLHGEWQLLIRPSKEGLWTEISTFLVYVSFIVLLVVLSVCIVQAISLEAVGSGIPEMKTVLRGVQLDGYLTARTLVSLLIGLSLVLGSGLPVGKAGPFVHAASIVANLVSRAMKSFDTGIATSSMHSEMLGESRLCGRIGLRLLCSCRRRFVLDRGHKCVLRSQKLLLFCGFGAAGFVAMHRWMVSFRATNPTMKKIFDKHWILYPLFVALLSATITYPAGIGNYLGGERKFGAAINDFFRNCTWMAAANSSAFCPEELRAMWLDGDQLDVFLVLASFTAVYFVLTGLALTLAIPSGIFGPAFAVGAAFGRLVGELVYVAYPDGVREQDFHPVFPGIYSIVGAAAFCGGITHSISVAVIAYELTGQLVFVLPVIIAVLISNAVSSYLDCSFYDSLIRIKKLPFLPTIPPSANFHGILVERFMIKNVRYISPATTYRELRFLLTQRPRLKAVPVVDSEESCILVGSCTRSTLTAALERQVGGEARRAEARARARRIPRKRVSTSMDASFPLLIGLSRKPSLVNVDTGEQFAVEPVPPPTCTPPRSASERNVDFFISDRTSLDSFPPTPSEVGTPRVFSIPGLAGRFTLSSVDLQAQDSPNATIHSAPMFANSLLADSLPRSQTEAIGLKRDLPTRVDLFGEERRQWEAERLAQTIELDELAVDPTPLQLFSKTSLLKCHSMFSLLGLTCAYITAVGGRLTGVVGLRELRLAIEAVQNGQLRVDGGCLFPDEAGEEQLKDGVGGEAVESNHSLPPVQPKRSVSTIAKTKTLPEIREHEDDSLAAGDSSSRIHESRSAEAIVIKMEDGEADDEQRAERKLGLPNQRFSHSPADQQ
ncbi:Chloride channel protein clh-3 [Aphelenchoides fujianensis]|nr:Chloride channel protein clh-3 [Aphelenchoides fujianensis]